MTNKEDIGGEFGEPPNDKYKVFFNKFYEIDTLPIAQWKPVHLIGYFCKKYYDQYGVKYKFKFNSPSPSKCYEIFQIKKMASLLSSDPQILVNYMDWVYATRVANGSRRLTSIAFMTVDSLLIEYKNNFLFSQQSFSDINRSSELPVKYKEVLIDFPNIKTYGALSFMYQAIKDGSFEQDRVNLWNQALAKLKTLGFNESTLNNLK